MRLSITHNNILPYLGTIGVVLAIGFTMKLIPDLKTTPAATPLIENGKTLRHVVLFKFKEGTTAEELKGIETFFGGLPSKIPEIVDFEWGTNNSPEGLDKGFTHCFFVSFADEKGREVYLPHPDHKAFVELASPHIDDVLVLDYWAD
ncbi:MAG: Dabb family protein [Bacteroidota bacterium]